MLSRLVGRIEPGALAVLAGHDLGDDLFALEVGMETVVQYAQRMGLSTPLRPPWW